ncbi:MAG: cell division protein FtsZ [Epsilonproteobacteria bacterium]|nr:cell division protein FtsZ [Campylobacterota bacterium]
MEELYVVNDLMDGPKIKVIGVGGGGNNMINYMANQDIKDVELIAANTDIQALKTSKAHKKIQLGKELTKGLGAGMRPEMGKQAAEESYNEIKEALEGADLVFISAGMGGGTGTGAAPVVARAAQEVGALTIGVVTKPFTFEGPKRRKLAEVGTNELKQETNSIVVIPNDKILTIIDRKVGRREAFSLVDNVLYQAVSGISNMVISYGENDINVDFNDLKTVMSHKGLALMGVGEEKGENAAYNALKKAIESPLLDNITIDGAMGVLVHYTMHEDYPLVEIEESMNIIYDKADEDADVIFGTTTDNSLEPDEIKVTIVATGFEKQKAVNKPDKEIKSAVEEMLVRKKVVGGLELDSDTLDIPTWMRKAKD